MSTADIHRIKRRLDLLEGGADHIDGGHSLFVVFLFFFFAQMVSGAILFIVRDDVSERWDFASYVFPAAAGAAAGFGLLRSRWIRPSFQVSVLLLWIGVICFVLSKGVGIRFVAAAGGITSTAIATYLIRQCFFRKKKDKRRHIEPEVFFYAVLLLASIAVAVSQHRPHRPCKSVSKAGASLQQARLPNLLVETRKKAKLTQSELAQAAGGSQPYASQIESGLIRLDGLQLVDWLQACNSNICDS